MTPPGGSSSPRPPPAGENRHLSPLIPPEGCFSLSSRCPINPPLNPVAAAPPPPHSRAVRATCAPLGPVAAAPPPLFSGAACATCAPLSPVAAAPPLGARPGFEPSCGARTVSRPGGAVPAAWRAREPAVHTPARVAAGPPGSVSGASPGSAPSCGAHTAPRPGGAAPARHRCVRIPRWACTGASCEPLVSRRRPPYGRPAGNMERMLLNISLSAIMA